MAASSSDVITRLFRKVMFPVTVYPMPPARRRPLIIMLMLTVLRHDSNAISTHFHRRGDLPEPGERKRGQKCPCGADNHSPRPRHGCNSKTNPPLRNHKDDWNTGKDSHNACEILGPLGNQ